jgi:hypothetical protein
MTDKQYAVRDAMALDQVGGHYFRHVMAMTAEKLHSKGDIAAELGYRDMQIAALQEQVQQLAAENVDLKSRTVKVPTKAYLKDMRCNVVRWSQIIDALSDAGVAFVRDDGELIAGTRDTPDTDAVIREIGAKAVERFGDVLGLGSLHLALILKKCAYEHAAKLRVGEQP